MLCTVTIEIVIRSAHAALHFACATIARTLLYVTRDPLFHAPSHASQKEAAKDTKCTVFA